MGILGPFSCDPWSEWKRMMYNGKGLKWMTVNNDTWNEGHYLADHCWDRIYSLLSFEHYWICERNLSWIFSFAIKLEHFVVCWWLLIFSWIRIWLWFTPFSNHKVVPFCKYSETLIGFYYWPPSSGAHPTPHTNVKLLLAVSCSSGSDKVNHQQRDVCPWNRSCVVSGSEWISSCLRSASTVSLQMANLNFAFSLRSVMSTVHSVAGTWWYFLPSSLLFLFLNKKQQMDVQAADEQLLTFLNQKDGFFYLYCRISKRYPTVWWFQPSFAVAG